jgi:5-methylcytosine-specific restriction endonuclease McrA
MSGRRTSIPRSVRGHCYSWRMGRRRWTNEQLRAVVASSTTLCEAIGKLGIVPRGANYALVQRTLTEQQIDTRHFQARSPVGGPRRSLEAVLVKGSSVTTSRLRKRLIRAKLKPACCELCGWAEVSPDGRVPLELDHRNGDRTDNRLENLRVLCPNCHSLQSTHRGVNARKPASPQQPPTSRHPESRSFPPPSAPRASGRKRTWSDDQLRAIVPISRSFAQVLRHLGIRGGGVRPYLYQRVIELELDTSHFLGRGWRVGWTTPSVPAMPLVEILVKDRPTKSSALRLRLISEGLKRASCERCGWAERAPDGRLPLELDHRNGDHDDNRLENLQILCPSCHSLQPTHRGSNQRRRRRTGAPGGT